MTGRHLSVVLALAPALALAGQVSWAGTSQHGGGGGGSHAVARSGGGGSHGSSGAVARSGAPRRPGSAVPHSPGLSTAQGRHPRAGTGTGGYHYYNGYHGYHGHYGYHGYYGGYYPYVYGSLYFGYGWPYYYPGYYWPGYYPPYAYYGSPYYAYPYPGDGSEPGDQGGDTSVDRDRSSEGEQGITAEEDSAPAARPYDDRDLGRLHLDVRPDDASIYVNDRFLGMAREIRTLDLPPGRHRIEVVRPGYRTEQREVQIAPGETSELAVELRRP